MNKFHDIDTLIDNFEGDPFVFNTYDTNAIKTNLPTKHDAYYINHYDTPAGRGRSSNIGLRPNRFHHRQRYRHGSSHWHRGFHHEQRYRPWMHSLYYTYPYTIPYSNPYGSCIYFDGIRYVPGLYNSIGSCVPLIL